MTLIKDITGKKFGKIKVISFVGLNKHHSALYLCRCDCGNEKIINGSDLRSGHIISCGCYKRTRLGKETTIHGLSKLKSYKRILKIRRHMLDRCYSTKSGKYKNYGARGIKVCDEWKNDFLTFYNWAINNGFNENLYQKEQSLDRIDVNGNYEPSNCRWVDSKTQARNKTNNVTITYNNETHCIKEWAEILSINSSTISYRLKLGLPLDLVFQKGKLPYNIKSLWTKQ